MKFVQMNWKKLIATLTVAVLMSLVLGAVGILSYWINLRPVDKSEILVIGLLATLLPISVLVSCQSGTWFDDDSKEGRGTRIILFGADPEIAGEDKAQRLKKRLLIFWIILATLFAFLAGIFVGEITDPGLQYSLIFLVGLMYQALGFVTEYLGRDRSAGDEPSKLGAVLFYAVFGGLALYEVVGLFILPLANYIVVPFLVKKFVGVETTVVLNLWNPWLVSLWFVLSWLLSRAAAWAHCNLYFSGSEIKT